MLLQILSQVAVAVAFLLAISIAVFVGRERLIETRREWLDRLRVSAPVLVLLGVVLVLNRLVRQAASGPDDTIGFYVTDLIRNFEGEFILVFQSYATESLTAYFSYVYVYGYAFLLIFPAVAYFALSDTVPFRRLIVAYSLNYAIGVTLYVLVFAYGPRNVMPYEVDVTMLYAPANSPEYQHLTQEVNRHWNVFPSLHTSLSATVAMLAYQTRDRYPKWLPVAVLGAISVAVSTMYLAIHWATDVVAGLVLAAFCVAVAGRLVGRWSVNDVLEDLSDRLEERTGWDVHSIRRR